PGEGGAHRGEGDRDGAVRGFHLRAERRKQRLPSELLTTSINPLLRGIYTPGSVRRQAAAVFYHLCSGLLLLFLMLRSKAFTSAPLRASVSTHAKEVSEITFSVLPFPVIVSIPIIHDELLHGSGAARHGSKTTPAWRGSTTMRWRSTRSSTRQLSTTPT
ncbi:hypothetical protein BHE74_00042890, partial [Ensete ventricosum]